MVLHAHQDLRPTRLLRSKTHPAAANRHHRYSRFVGTMKVTLPALAVVLLGLVAAWPQLAHDDDRFQLGYASLSPSAVQNLSMVNARYHGLDKNNRPFMVTADKATEIDPKIGLVKLENPKADFLSRSGASIYVESRTGFYRQHEGLLDMEGDVNLFHDEGYELHTEQAQANVKTSSVEGHEPVAGSGPKGRIQGQGFTLLDNGRQIMVTGKSELWMKGASRK